MGLSKKQFYLLPVLNLIYRIALKTGRFIYSLFLRHFCWFLFRSNFLFFSNFFSWRKIVFLCFTLGEADKWCRRFDETQCYSTYSTSNFKEILRLVDTRVDHRTVFTSNRFLGLRLKLLIYQMIAFMNLFETRLTLNPNQYTEKNIWFHTFERSLEQNQFWWNHKNYFWIEIFSFRIQFFAVRTIFLHGSKNDNERFLWIEASMLLFRMLNPASDTINEMWFSGQMDLFRAEISSLL